MRRLSLAALLLAVATQAAAPLLAGATESDQRAAELQPITEMETPKAEEQVAPAAGSIAEPAPPEPLPPVPVSEEGAPTEDRLSIGQSVRSQSPEPAVEPAQEETVPLGGEEPVEDDGVTTVPVVPDEEDPDEEEFSEEFEDEAEDEEPPVQKETPTAGDQGTSPPVVPSSTPVASLPSTGLDVISVALAGVALLLLGLSLRRVPATRV